MPQRNKNGAATSTKTNIVYTVDAVRGLDVYTVDLPGSTTAPSLLGGLAPAGIGNFGSADPRVTLLAAGLTGLVGVGLVRRRRQRGRPADVIL